MSFRTSNLFHKPIYKNPGRKTCDQGHNDTNTLSEMYTSVLIDLLKNVFTIIGVMTSDADSECPAHALGSGFSPLLVIISFVFRKLSRKAYREVRNNLTDVNTFLSENISEMKVTQFQPGTEEIAGNSGSGTKLSKSSLKEIFIFGIFRPTIYVIHLLTTALVLWFGARSALGASSFLPEVRYDMIITFTQYVDMLFNPLQQLAEQFNILQSAFASAEKDFSVLDTEPEIVDEPDAVELEDLRARLNSKMFGSVIFPMNGF